MLQSDVKTLLLTGYVCMHLEAGGIRILLAFEKQDRFSKGPRIPKLIIRGSGFNGQLCRICSCMGASCVVAMSVDEGRDRGCKKCRALVVHMKQRFDHLSIRTPSSIGFPHSVIRRTSKILNFVIRRDKPALAASKSTAPGLGFQYLHRKAEHMAMGPIGGWMNGSPRPQEILGSG